MEAALGANECLVTRQKHRETGVICELDLEKAYDSVYWTFLLNFMTALKFGDDWFQ